MKDILKTKVAVRNLAMCEKDCLCLYVCPTGASDTENSIIDVDKCIGCGVCADACPSKAISMVPITLPPQQKKTERVVSSLISLAKSKEIQEQIASGIKGKIARAIEKSTRIMAEDIVREAGYMLPQSKNSYDFLIDLKEKIDDDDVLKDIDFLLDKIEFNEEFERTDKMEKWRCSVCGHIHEGPITEDYTCPVCRQPSVKFRKIED